jgi:glutathione S-transferase
MRLLDSVGPNPKVVRMFIAERGITGISLQTIDLRGGENRQPPYLAKNPTGQCPTLELDDGSYLTEITAICEYLDETAPGSSLIGATPQERAETRMWTRRIDLAIVEPMTAGFRYAEGLKFFTPRMRCIPQAADDLQTLAKDEAGVAGRADRRTHVHLRRPPDPCRHPAVRIPTVRRDGAATAGSREYQPHRLV